jgi:hypothetical protein
MAPIDDFASARRYLAPFASSFWRWDDEGEVIAWIGGQTIAFRGELQGVLARLAAQGLPPFSAVVLLLAACRDGWEGESNRLSAMAGLVTTRKRRGLPEWLGKLFSQLDAVHALPAELRTTPWAKADLAALVFEECPVRTLPEEAEAVRWAVSSCLGPDMLAPQADSPRGLDGVLRGLRCLHEGLDKVDAEKLRLRRRTGLDQLVQPAEVDLPPAEGARRLIARLRHDPELGGVARIAGQLSAAVHLPRSLSDREDLPVGGVSDISHRGPLDRLLSSELAHDDLTLAVRIALNETLYLRREAPPRCPPRHRAVLIDAGIRLWGVPRVFAAAVALALVATADRNIRVDVYRARGRSVEPVTLTQREGLIAHLEALEPDAHPGDALAAFSTAVRRQGDLVDAVVVTGEDVAADPAFRQAIAALEVPALLLATVNREGRFRLASYGARHTRVLREARLDLDKLLAAPSRPVARLWDAAAPALPAILGQKPFPLLLSPSPVDPRRAWTVPGSGVLSICRDRCLLHWQRPGRGARLLANDAPAGHVHWAGSGAGESTSLAVVGQLQCRRLWLLRVDLETGDYRSLPLDLGGQSPLGVFGHGGAAMVVYADCAEVFEPLGWRRLQLMKLPRGARWQHGRFLRGRDGWYAISHDGLTARVEPLVAPHRQREAPQFLAVVDNPHGDGPIALTTEGHLYNLARERVIRVAHGLLGIPRVVAMARGGERIVIAQRDDRSKMSLIEVPSGAARTVSGNPAAHVEPDIVRHTAGAPNVGHRFRAVCIDEGRHLAIQRLKGSLAAIQLDRQGRGMILGSGAFAAGCPELTVDFQEIKSPGGAGYTLRAATWKDGSRAVLDSRGMLHLRSSETAIPELTLVLATGALAGWCADGRWFGSPYFIGEHVPTPGAVIYEEVLKPFVLRLR